MRIMSYSGGRFEGGVMPYAPVRADAPGCSRETAITITDLNEATRTIVESSFGRFWVKGEVGDFKRTKTGTGTSAFATRRRRWRA